MEINVNVQPSTENQQPTNDNHNYDNRHSFNNLPLHPGECLVPIRVDWEMVKHFNTIKQAQRFQNYTMCQMMVQKFQIIMYHQTM